MFSVPKIRSASNRFLGVTWFIGPRLEGELRGGGESDFASTPSFLFASRHGTASAFASNLSYRRPPLNWKRFLGFELLFLLNLGSLRRFN